MTNERKISLPSMLAFERKLEVSDALMYAGNWEQCEQEETKDNWETIQVVPRKNRSTQSAYGIKDVEKSRPNPISAGNDDANLPHDRDTLRVSFTLRIVGNLGQPFGCNDPVFEDAIKEKVDKFKETGLKELAHRYAHNIASGRFLWRNRVCAENLKIKVKVNHAEEAFIFNGYDFALNDFGKSRDHTDLVQLSSVLFDGLNSSDDFVLIEVEAYVRLGRGQHVFPSQEMNMGEKKKVLFKLGEENCAALHSVKVGNAIRTIDDWYAEETEFPIAVEPFGSVTQRGEAYRKSKNDLYSLMMGWVNNKSVSDKDKYFVIANLIRGGVFGGKAD